MRIHIYIHTPTQTNTHTSRRTFNTFIMMIRRSSSETSKLLIKKQYCAYSTYNEREGFSFGCTRSTHTHTHTHHHQHTPRIQIRYSIYMRWYCNDLEVRSTLELNFAATQPQTHTHLYNRHTPHTHRHTHAVYIDGSMYNACVLCVCECDHRRRT